jgi:hypothetical protein
MNDKDIEKIQTIDITVTAESLDAHVQCLKDNGYSVNKNTTNFLHLTLCFLIGAFTMGTLING